MNERLPNGQFLRIDRITAYIAVDKDGNEGIMGMSTPSGMMPLIGADVERNESLKVFAEAISKVTGVRYVVRHFRREDN